MKEKLANIDMLATPNSEGELVVITDASLVGGSGTLFQWQKLAEWVACTVAQKVQKTLQTLGMNRDGTFKHNHDPGCWHQVPIGHWNWKWYSTRANYGTLLSGIPLLSGQGHLLGTNPLVRFCYQQSTEYLRRTGS